MNQYIAHIALVITDYDEAISFYTDKLHFDLIEDTYIPDQYKRWVLIRPPGGTGTCILLARASDPIQKAGYRRSMWRAVCFILYTDDFERDYNNLIDSSFGSKYFS